MFEKHFVLENCPNVSKTVSMPKIAVKFSKMASPDQIWYRGSLTTPIIAKGLRSFNNFKSSLMLQFCIPIPTGSHWRCSVKKMLLKIWEILHENTCVRVSF